MSKRLSDLSLVGGIATFVGLFCVSSHAGTVSCDTILVSTISGQATLKGLTISSDVFLSPGSSLTLQGAGGYIMGSSSITAQSFMGDGSQLSGVAVLTSTQTFGGSNTFNSSFTVQTRGNQVILSTSSVVSNFKLSPAGAIAFYPELHNSSHTTIPNGSTSATTFGSCVTGSTLTIATTGGRVEVAFTGTLFTNGGGMGITFLQDGGFVRNLNSSAGIGYGIRVLSGATHIERTLHFSYLLDAPNAGSHSYCIALRGTAGNTVQLEENNTVGNIFYVQEIK